MFRSNCQVSLGVNIARARQVLDILPGRVDDPGGVAVHVEGSGSKSNYRVSPKSLP